MRVVVQKIDMDTVLAAWILGASRAESVTVAPRGASAEDLADPDVVCLEAGGSGDTLHGNFDHHGFGAPDEAACVQAARHVAVRDARVCRLVEYVAAVDGGRLRVTPPPAFPSLSNLFSGLLLSERDSRTQFAAGLRLFETIVALDTDPFGTMPDRAEWRSYVTAKRAAQARLADDVAQAVLFTTASGATAGFLQTDQPGALGALYELGCRYAIACNEHCRDAAGGPARKITIGARDGYRVDHLVPVLAAREPGWGGPSHGTIIGSPRGGTRLSITALRDLVRSRC